MVIMNREVRGCCKEVVVLYPVSVPVRDIISALLLWCLIV